MVPTYGGSIPPAPTKSFPKGKKLGPPLWGPFHLSPLPQRVRQQPQHLIGGHILGHEGLTDAGLRIRTLRLPDVFQDHDAPDKQYDLAGLNAPQIVDCVLRALRHNSAGVEEARA